VELVKALPVRNAAGTAGVCELIGMYPRDYGVGVVSAERLVRRRLLPRVETAQWMPWQWCNCHPERP
jgi:hypothetical protein